MTAVFLSDVHLRDAASVKTKLVVRFLQEVAAQFDRIYILGDLFDVWPGTSAHLVRTYRPVIKILRRLVKAGHEIHYLEGNHDFHLGKYFRERIGIKTYADKIEETWNGRRIYMAHGDLGNPRDYGYRALRYFLRSPIALAAIRAFPPKFVHRVGLDSSRLSRKYSSGKLDDELKNKIRQTYRDTAETLFHRGYDMVIMGHTHLPDDFQITVNSRLCRYINLGDWVYHFTYLEFDGSQFYTRSHPVKTL